MANSPGQQLTSPICRLHALLTGHELYNVIKPDQLLICSRL